MLYVKDKIWVLAEERTVSDDDEELKKNLQDF